MTFSIGQKVVCVDDAYPNVWPDNVLGYRIPHRPKGGYVYTIRELEPFASGHFAGELGVRLVELINPTVEWDDRPTAREGCFNAKRFRALTEDGLDISIFTKMLEPAD